MKSLTKTKQKCSALASGFPCGPSKGIKSASRGGTGHQRSLGERGVALCFTEPSRQYGCVLQADKHGLSLPKGIYFYGTCLCLQLS